MNTGDFLNDKKALLAALAAGAKVRRVVVNNLQGTTETCTLVDTGEEVSAKVLGALRLGDIVVATSFKQDYAPGDHLITTETWEMIG